MANFSPAASLPRLFAFCFAWRSSSSWWFVVIVGGVAFGLWEAFK
jgi:hypothetical protein